MKNDGDESQACGCSIPRLVLGWNGKRELGLGGEFEANPVNRLLLHSQRPDSFNAHTTHHIPGDQPRPQTTTKSKTQARGRDLLETMCSRMLD